MENDDKQFIEQVRQGLDECVEQQSPRLLGRLRAARREALSGATGRPANLARHRWLGAALASLFVVIASTSLWFESSQGPESSVGAQLLAVSASDQQMLRQGDDMELYQDLEFYYWLQQEQAHAG